jgi:hypothetical protein
MAVLQSEQEKHDCEAAQREKRKTLSIIPCAVNTLKQKEKIHSQRKEIENLLLGYHTIEKY